MSSITKTLHERSPRIVVPAFFTTVCTASLQADHINGSFTEGQTFFMNLPSTLRAARALESGRGSLREERREEPSMERLQENVRGTPMRNTRAEPPWEPS
jgi:hypothetical protein